MARYRLSTNKYVLKWPKKKLQQVLNLTKKNPTYGRHWISWQMWIEAQIVFFFKYFFWCQNFFLEGLQIHLLGDGVHFFFFSPKKHRKNCKKLPREHLISCWGVKLFLLNCVTITIFFFFFTIWVFEFGHNLSFWFLSHFEFFLFASKFVFLSLVKSWV